MRATLLVPLPGKFRPRVLDVAVTIAWPAVVVSVLVSAEKLNAASPYVIAPVTGATAIIVSSAISEEATAPYLELGITVTRA